METVRELNTIRTMINLERFSSELVERDGILFAKKDSHISYPEKGNEICFQIEDDSFWFKHRLNCIIEAVKKFCPHHQFFDIGGGNGFVAKGLEDNGIQTVLLEPGAQGCQNAKKRKLKNIICATLENAAIKSNSIPAVGLFDVVEHIEHDTDFLKAVYNLLEAEGYIFITVPAYKSLWSKEDDDAGHYRRYTTKELEDKLKQVGFEIAYSTYIFSLLPLPVFLFRSLPSKLGLNKNSADLEKQRNEHKANNNLVNKMLDKVWNFEIDQIKAGKTIPFGGSCLVVAKKN
jgi:2-polyprenyl-3-methyl-5-hydroxy-6-metoxy-1,4-benzoquinol methylase